MILTQTKNLNVICPLHTGLPNLAFDYYVIRQGEDLIGLFEIQPLTKITGILHLHIQDRWQNKGYGTEAFFELIRELKKNKKYKSIIGSIPAKNEKIMSIVNKTEGKCCGIIKDGIVFNNELQDLLLFQLGVN